jgi:hydrogenase large subunit
MTKTPETPLQKKLVEMAWDPITRIVGSLGIHTKIDFEARRVAECYSTSSIFRGYSVFMRGKDPRDAHFITSRICGICGDNHATCAIYSQNMAFGVRPPHLAEWIINLGEAAEYMFDHNLFQDNLVGVDFCEQMVRETNPGVLAKAEKTEAPHGKIHGYRTIADIMRALNPFTGAFYLEALHMSRLTREMFCLMEGRHVHPSTIYPGGVGTVPSVQLFNDYLVRLLKYIDFLKRCVPLHDDLFDFFYEALPGYEEVGRRRIMMACYGSFQNPDVCDFKYETMNQWGRAMYVTPGIVLDGKLITTDLIDINLGIRILLGSSFYSDWHNEKPFVTKDPLGNPVDPRHPWNQTTLPKPQKRDFSKNYTWVMSPRWFDKASGAHLALDTGGGPLARFWVTALAGVVDIGGYVKATGHSVKIRLPKTANHRETELEWKIPKWSNTLERDRARSYFQAYAAGAALYFIEKALEEVHGGRLKTWNEFKVPQEAISCGFHEAVRGTLSHHMVIREGRIANYHPYPPTPWNASPRDSFGTPGPYEDAVMNTPIFEENGPDKFKGIDIMRTVRSFDPCLPCGVHMYVVKATSAVEQIANAVLYEGFLLYPYRLSSVKNRHRWNFGVLYPAPFGGLNGERETIQTECLIEAGDKSVLDVKVRFLQMIDGSPVEREVLAANLDLEELARCPHESCLSHSGVEGKLEVRARKTGAGIFQVTANISNLGRFNGENRDEALARSLISTHAILTTRGGRFISLIDPPEQFQAAAAQCHNAGLWPVLVGRDDTQCLSAPIILYDHPRIAPQSPGDLFDGTEIDEILTLRIQTLTDDEKLEMRATDGRARAILERSEALTRAELSRLHAPMYPDSGARFKKGDRVRLQPRRRADIFDIALAGKLATVVSVEQDFEDGVHLCVTVDDDPGKDLGVEGKPGHRFFFGTDEVEPA